jgi:hypothetical protein
MIMMMTIIIIITLSICRTVLEPSPLLLRPFIGLLYQPWMNEWQGKLKYSKKTCPSAALSITDPT